MTNLRSLRVKGFRGARFDLPLDFTSDRRSVAIFGDNATGKSTFTDAIEWFLSGRVDHLWREDCKEDALRNVLLDPTDLSEVALEIVDPPLKGRKQLSASLHITTAGIGDSAKKFLSELGRERIILRHFEIRKFIDQTKSQKRGEIATIIGYAAIVAFRDTIQSTGNALRRDAQYHSAKANAEEAGAALLKLTGRMVSRREQLFAVANSIASPHGVKVHISGTESYAQAIEELRAQIANPNKAEQKLLFEALRKECDSLRDEALGVVAVADALDGPYNNLVRQSEAVRQLNIEQFLTRGRDVIDGGYVAPAQCPFCLTPYDLIALREEVSRRIDKIAEIRIAYEKTGTKKAALQTAIGGLHRRAKAFVDNYGDAQPFKLIVDAAASAARNLALFSESIEDRYGKFEPIDFSEDKLKWVREFATAAEEHSHKARGQAEAVELTAVEKAIVESIEKLTALRAHYRQYRTNDLKAQAFEAQILSLSAIFEAFIPAQNEAMQAVLNKISKDVGAFYRVLHPSENVDKVELKVVGEEGIEFQYHFHGKPTHPPLKYLSESHLNSLGVCLFLASAKLFNRKSRFIVLDDVVTSFDLGHRRRFIRLLQDEFAGWQIVILTHERLWFELIKKELMPSGWLFKAVEWSSDNGVQLVQSLADQREFIAKKRQQYDVSNDIRKLLEASLKDVCHALQVKVPFRFNDENERRMSGELLSSLRSAINSKCGPLKSAPIFARLDASNLIATVGSHDNPGEVITGGDIDVALDDIDSFMALFTCEDCGRLVDASCVVIGEDQIACRCGKTKLAWKQ